MNWRLVGGCRIYLGFRMVCLETLQPKEGGMEYGRSSMRGVQVSVEVEGRRGPRVVGIRGPGGLVTKLPLKPSFIRGLEWRVVILFWEGLPLVLCQPYYWKHLKGGDKKPQMGPVHCAWENWCSSLLLSLRVQGHDVTRVGPGVHSHMRQALPPGIHGLYLKEG